MSVIYKYPKKIDYVRLLNAMHYAPHQQARRDGTTFATYYLMIQMLTADDYGKHNDKPIDIPFFVRTFLTKMQLNELAFLIPWMLPKLQVGHVYRYGNPVLIIWKRLNWWKKLFGYKPKITHRIIPFNEDHLKARLFRTLVAGSVNWTGPFMDHYFYESCTYTQLAEIEERLGEIIWNFRDLTDYYQGKGIKCST